MYFVGLIWAQKQIKTKSWKHESPSHFERFLCFLINSSFIHVTADGKGSRLIWFDLASRKIFDRIEKTLRSLRSSLAVPEEETLKWPNF